MARDYSKGVPLRHIKKGKATLCATCSCVPCQCTKQQQQEVRRQNNANSYNNAQAEKEYERQHGGSGWGRMPATKKPAKKTKAKPKQSKAAFTRDFKKRNPTASDAEVKKAQKKAGYSVGCLSVVVFLALTFSGTGWGIYEGIRAITG